MRGKSSSLTAAGASLYLSIVRGEPLNLRMRNLASRIN